jgi:hypothetical protein
MSWKNVKEHYHIGHSVQITQAGICIGSPYIHDLIIIGLDGRVKKGYNGHSNEDLLRYMAEMKADPEKLRQLVQTPDTFTTAIPVYTYAGGEIMEKQCEELGWPNVTHDGCMMYESTFSEYKAKVVWWAKQNAQAKLKSFEDVIERRKRDLAKAVVLENTFRVNLAKLETDYPEVKA